jgi:hypothetical protein
MACLIPRPLQNAVQEAEENCVGLSEVTVSMTPKHGTQVEKKTSVQVEAEMLLRGMASSHHVVRSTIVVMYKKPSSDAEKEPTRSLAHG